MHLSLASAFPATIAAIESIPPNLYPVVIGGMLLGLLGLGIGFAAIITDARIERSRHETIRFALEKGQPVPPELQRASDRPRRPRDDRRSGLVCLVLSPGLFVFLRMLGLGPLAYVGLITACVGIALLLNAWLDARLDAAHRATAGEPRA